MLTDLHMHSYYSDGTMSPREIVEDAKKRNVQLIAITDHNVLDSYTELKEAAEEFGIKVIRGVEIEKALGILQFSHRESAPKLRKLLLSAIANWQVKNEGKRVEESGLYVKRITVDGGRQLKRLRTAPQGRGYRIKKRSNHITLELGSKVEENAVSAKSTDAEK